MSILRNGLNFGLLSVSCVGTCFLDVAITYHIGEQLAITHTRSTVGQCQAHSPVAWSLRDRKLHSDYIESNSKSII